ncbi:MAG: YbhB/YbcL family Raf kinase inhibitor-like protein [Stenotrophobium sp.]
MTTATTLHISSPAFAGGAAIPRIYTCEGQDLSPPLQWSGLPAGTRSVALIIEDPDAPDPAAPRMTWVHWVVYDIPASVSELPQAAQPLPGGTRSGHNSWKRDAYGGPCPPIGRHRYFHRLYALDTTLPDLDHPTATQLRQAMHGHVLAETALIGTYQKENTQR